MSIELSDGGGGRASASFMLAAKRVPKLNRTVGDSYRITTSSTDLGKGVNYVGKLKSNFIGTEWVLYDAGLKPHQAVALARSTENCGANGAASAAPIRGSLNRRAASGRSATTLPLDALTTDGRVSSAASTLHPDAAHRLGTGQTQAPIAYPSLTRSRSGSTESGSDVGGDEDSFSERSVSVADGMNDASSGPLGAGALAAARVRRELALISCSQNVLGEAAPRKIYAVLPWTHAPRPGSSSSVGGDGSSIGGGATAAVATDAVDDEATAVGSASERSYAAPGLQRVHRPMSLEQTLKELVREPGELSRSQLASFYAGLSRRGGVLQLCSRAPKLNKETGARSLNFGGRVKWGSVKNFQMELADPSGAAPQEDHEREQQGLGAADEHVAPSARSATWRAAQRDVVLGADGEPPLIIQFGKAGKDAFILDFRHPLTPVQAFALGITAMARKIASEGG